MTNLPTGQHDASAESSPLGRILGLVTAGLGVLTFLFGFAPLQKIGVSGYSGGRSFSFYDTNGAAPVALLLLAGLLAGVGLLPKHPKQTAAAAAAAVTGFLVLVAVVIGVATTDGYSLGFGAYIVVVLGLVLAAAAVGAYLIEAGIISPQQRQPQQQRGYAPYAQQQGGAYGAGAGQYGSAPSQGQYGAPQQGGYAQGAPQEQGPGQQYSGSYGAPAPQQQFGQGQAPYQPQGQPQAPYQQQGQPQAAQYPSSSQQGQEGGWKDGEEEADDRTRAYTPPTQTFGAQPAEGEQPPGNQYGAPPQQ